MTENDEADVRALPRPKQRNHRWGTASAVIGDTPSGCQETHRACEACKIIKVTVHPPHGLPYRIWQYRDGERADGLTPMCDGGAA